jgi:hypothetical protein
MEPAIPGVSCARCKKPLETLRKSADRGRCRHCGAWVCTDEKYHSALTIATANEGWVEKVFWREQTNDVVAIVLLLLVFWPLSVLKILTIGAIGFGALAAIVMLFEIPSMPFDWRLWLTPPLIVAVPAGIFWLLQRIEPAIKKVVPKQFLCVLYLVISSRGLVVLASYTTPFFLPWACIVGYRFRSDVMTMTSQIMIDYSTADGQTATILLDGEEYNQPLGEIVDVLEARIGHRFGFVSEPGPHGH